MLNIDFYWIFLGIPAIIMALTIHEYAHAWMAYRLGDATAKSLGRLTLNPLAHLDPIGLIAMIIFRFGWAKPVPINPYNFEHPIKGEFYVSIAGPISNLLQAIVGAFILKILYIFPHIWIITELSFSFLGIYIFVNLILMAFNMIPIPPLDGYSVLKLISPLEWLKYFQLAEQYSIYFLLLIMLPGSPFQTVISYILQGIVGFSFQILIKGFGLTGILI